VLGNIIWLVKSARKRKITTGREALIGEKGRAVSSLNPEGTVFVHGEYWNARSISGPISRDERIEVVSVDGMTLVVQKNQQNQT